MSMKFLSPIDLGQNELQNARIQNLATDPGSPLPGQFWFNTTTFQLKVYDGTAIRVLAGLQNKLTDFAAPSSALQLAGQTIQNLGNPVNATDAATKQYVDSDRVSSSCRTNRVAHARDRKDAPSQERTAAPGNISALRFDTPRICVIGPARRSGSSSCRSRNSARVHGRNSPTCRVYFSGTGSPIRPNPDRTPSW